MTDAKTKTTKKSSAKPAVKSRASGATVKKAAGKTTGTKGGQKNDQGSTAAKGRGRSKSTAQQTMPLKKEKSLLRYEIELITLFALTILSAVAIHTNLTGYFGAIMKAIYLGLFGFAGILLTYMIFMLIFFNINPYFKEKRLRLSFSAVCLFIAVLLLASGINYAAYSDVIDKQGYTIGSAEALRISFNQGIDLRGGGILGNLLTEGLISAIGKFGVYLTSLLLFTISIVLAFKVSLTSWVKRGGVNTYKGLKPVAGKLKQMPEQMQQKRLEQAKVEAAKIEDAKQAENMETESKQPIDAFDSDLYFEDQQTQPTDEAVTSALTSDTLEEATLNQLDSTSETYIDEETGEYINVETVIDIEGSLEPMDVVDDDVSVVHFEVPDLAETQAEVAEDLSTSEMPAFKFTDSIEETELTEVIEVDDVEVGEEPELIAETAAVVKPPLKTEPEPVVKPVVIPKPYIKPPLSLLNPPKAKVAGNREEIAENVKVLEATLKSFGVDARVTEVTKGPAITMYEVSPAPGVKVSKIVNLQDDIALALAASQIRIIAPIPGKSAVGIEIPNKDTTMVTAREVFESEEFKKSDSKLAFGLGKDITGRTIIADLAKMPHLLIAGSTGSGKSVCVNTIINSILFNATPDEVKLLMVDPKVVELSHYNGIPHLILPVVVDPKKASIALNWAVNEMTNRYKTFAENMVKDINTYNRKAETQPDLKLEKMPKIVVLVDELADLMMVAPNQVEDAICRLAQMARAAGIHLIVATQRPSVDVITGVIKANIPSRIAFAVSSQIDSRTIIDGAGAEKLLGKGDMLFAPLGSNKPIRVQGAFLADPEVEAVVEFVKNQATDVTYQEEILSDYVEATTSSEADEILQDAIELVVDTGQASISMLQRKFRVGYNRAARLIDQMEERNIVGPSLGSKPREVLLTKLEWENIKNT